MSDLLAFGIGIFLGVWIAMFVFTLLMAAKRGDRT